MSAIKVHRLDEGGWLVRGAKSVSRARVEILRAHWQDYDGTAREVLTDLRRMHGRVGLFRIQPCICGGDHRWDVFPADTPGRGAFPGVGLWSW